MESSAGYRNLHNPYALIKHHIQDMQIFMHAHAPNPVRATTPSPTGLGTGKSPRCADLVKVGPVKSSTDRKSLRGSRPKPLTGWVQLHSTTYTELSVCAAVFLSVQLRNHAILMLHRDFYIT